MMMMMMTTMSSRITSTINGKPFHTRRPTTAKILSPKLFRVRVSHICLQIPEYVQKRQTENS